MATTNLLLAAGLAWGLLTLLAAPAPAAASQMTLYETTFCSSGYPTQTCTDGQCCSLSDVYSYSFNFSDGQPARIFRQQQECDGFPNEILWGSVSCENTFSNYKSVKIGLLQEDQLIKLPGELDAGHN